MQHKVNSMGSAGFAVSEGYASMGERRLSLAQLWSRGARLATALAERDVTTDSPVAILMRNDLAFLEAMIACSILGAYAVPLNWHLSGDEVAYILNDSDAKVLLAHSDLYRRVEDRLSPIQALLVETPSEIRQAYALDSQVCALGAGDASYDSIVHACEERGLSGMPVSRGSIIYTSGTTGRPKGVRRATLSDDKARAFRELSQRWFDLGPGIRSVMAGPAYHSAPNTYTRAVLHSGGSIALMPRFDARALLSLIERDRVTHLHLVPTMFIRLLALPPDVRARYDISSLKFVVHGAAPCPHEVKRAMIDWWGPIIHEYYAATETGMVSRSSSEEWLVRPGTLGKAWPGREIRIYDDNGARCGPGEVGEVYVSLHGVPDFSYLHAADRRREIERDGLVSNGDVGYLDEDGYLFLVDRKKDMVISGGVNLYPAEVECALAEHEKVLDCAVIGVPDPEFGEKLLAYVQVAHDHGLTADSLMIYLRTKLAGLKVPRAYKFVSELPRDDSGKLMKRKLRDPYWSDMGRTI
ncbi:AMP-binding protein [Comamonadaceae bacterium G21597-S1]|nr:AMP-binding protein [Comamonadaceae bacterium G21597-S1]